MDILLIANPVAGRGRARGAIGTLAQRLEARGHRVEVFLTGADGDAGRRAGEVEGRVDRLIVAGGDGTLNEVINGLRDPSRVPVALFPLGTANVVARELGLPVRCEDVADLVGRGEVRRMDLGVLGGRRFAAVASAGFDAEVVRAVGASRSGSLGFRGYLRPVLRTLLRYRPPLLAARVDDGPPVVGAMVVVGNIATYGGILRITDRARCDSARLDVAVLHRGTPRALVSYGLSALHGRLSARRDVTYLTGTRVSIRSSAPVAVEVDGDFCGETPVDVTILPGTFPMLTAGTREEGRR